MNPKSFIKIRPTDRIIKHIEVTKAKTIYLEFKYRGTHYFRRSKKNQQIDGFCLRRQPTLPEFGNNLLLEIPINQYEIYESDRDFNVTYYRRPYGYRKIFQTSVYVTPIRHESVFTFDNIATKFYKIVEAIEARGIKLHLKLRRYEYGDTQEFVIRLLKDIPKVTFDTLVIHQNIGDILTFINPVSITYLKYSYSLTTDCKTFDKYCDLLMKVTKKWEFNCDRSVDVMFIIRIILYMFPYVTWHTMSCDWYIRRNASSKLFEWYSLIAASINQITLKQYCSKIMAAIYGYAYNRVLRYPFTHDSCMSTIYDHIQSIYSEIVLSGSEKINISLRYFKMIKEELFNEILKKFVLIPQIHEIKHIYVFYAIINESLCKYPNIEYRKIINKNSNNKNSITYECTQKTEDRYIAIKNILSDAFSTNNIAEKLDKWCKICGSFHTDKVSEQHIDMESRFMIDPHIGSECKTTFARFLITHPLYDPRLLLYIISFAGVNTKSQPTYHYRSEIFTFMKLIEFYYAAYTLDAISAPPQQPPQPPQ